VVESTRVTTSTPESPDVPARNGFTAYFALSPVTGLFATVAREYGLPAPGRADRTSANLTPASGRQDHTTSPYAATSLVRVLLTAQGFLRTRPAIPSRARRCRVHRIPCPTFVTIAKRPSVWDGMTRLIEMFLPTTEAKYFCKGGWTPLSTNRPTGKSLDCGENTFRVSRMRCSAISAFTRVSTRRACGVVRC
jgi:hypothetical protein